MSVVALFVRGVCKAAGAGLGELAPADAAAAARESPAEGSSMAAGGTRRLFLRSGTAGELAALFVVLLPPLLGATDDPLPLLFPFEAADDSFDGVEIGLPAELLDGSREGLDAKLGAPRSCGSEFVLAAEDAVDELAEAEDTVDPFVVALPPPPFWLPPPLPLLLLFPIDGCFGSAGGRGVNEFLGRGGVELESADEDAGGVEATLIGAADCILRVSANKVQQQQAVRWEQRRKWNARN